MQQLPLMLVKEVVLNFLTIPECLYRSSGMQQQLIVIQLLLLLMSNLPGDM
jgi:hypothetical protein